MPEEAPLLDMAPYPFGIALARELHMVLCQLYPTGKAAMFVAQKAGVAVHMINAEQPPYLVWKDVLELAANSGLMKRLATVVVNDFPIGPYDIEFLDQILVARVAMA